MKLVLLTYAPLPPADGSGRFALYPAINEEMRRVAASPDVLLADTRPRFSVLLAAAPHERYFLSFRDGHPNAAGYREIGRLVADVIEPLAR